MQNPYFDSNWKDRTKEVEAMQSIILAAIKNNPDKFAKLVTDFYFHWKHNTFETPMMADFDESVKKLI